MSVNTWKVQPIHLMIVETLERKLSLADTELFKALKAFK